VFDFLYPPPQELGQPYSGACPFLDLIVFSQRALLALLPRFKTPLSSSHCFRDGLLPHFGPPLFLRDFIVYEGCSFPEIF